LHGGISHCAWFYRAAQPLGTLLSPVKLCGCCHHHHSKIRSVSKIIEMAKWESIVSFCILQP
jgi:hypothetical protein